MRRSEFLRLGAATFAAAALSVMTTGCVTRQREVAAAPRILVPAAAGGGYDLTARTVAKLIGEDTASHRHIDVFNVPGSGGLIGLSRMTAAAGIGDLAMAMGLGVVGAGWVAGRQAEVAALTPLAALAEEPGAIIVAPTSRLASMRDLTELWRRDPGAVRLGSGSGPGGPDQLLAVRVGRAIGIAADALTVEQYAGGGEVLSHLVAGELDAAFVGTGEMRAQILAGAVRVLAVSSAAQVDGIDAPTLAQAGIPVVFHNWRGFAGPPEMHDTDRDSWITALREMRETSAWRDALAGYGWTDAYAEGDEFQAFIDAETRGVAELLAD